MSTTTTLTHSVQPITDEAVSMFQTFD
jgi:hypothetical protein